jgi:hypothetical protein
VFSGIPPYCSLLQHIAEVKSEQSTFFNSFVEQVKQALQEYGVNAGALTEEWVTAIMNNFLQQMNGQLTRLDGIQTNAAAPAVSERVETGSGYSWHMYEGTFHRVPKPWKFPRCGIRTIWRQWWVGDQQRQIPPLKYLEYSDVKHINGMPLEDVEKQRKVGPNLDNRRLISKTLADMRFLCCFLSKLVKE